MDYDHSVKFARYLLSTQQYSFASEEYERIFYSYPGDSAVTLELVRSYRLGNRCDKFIFSRSILGVDKETGTYKSYLKEYLRYVLDCRIQNESYFNALANFGSDRSPFYFSSYYWVNHQFENLFEYAMDNEEAMREASPSLYQLTLDYNQQKFKSPLLAASLSTLIPGSGKVFTKNYGDAIISFLFVSTNAYISYRAFDKKGIKSLNGWIFGGMGFSFYFANIWGSAKSAKIFNTQIKKSYQKDAENIIYSSY